MFVKRVISNGKPSWSTSRMCHSHHRRRHQAPSCNRTYDKAIYEDLYSFGEKIYWDQRYMDEKSVAGKDNFEWYKSYEALRDILLTHFDPACPLLHVGVGSSLLQESMVEQDGFSRIVNTDFSPVCIEMMKQRHSHLHQLSYDLDDVRSMQYVDGSFDGCLDKGVLDALLCSCSAEEDSAKMMSEVLRALRPRGYYLCITSQAPKDRLKYLLDNSHPVAADSSHLHFSSVEAYEVGQQLRVDGPYLIWSKQNGPDESIIKSLPRMTYSHYVYACKRCA